MLPPLDAGSPFSSDTSSLWKKGRTMHQIMQSMIWCGNFLPPGPRNFSHIGGGSPPPPILGENGEDRELGVSTGLAETADLGVLQGE